MACRLAGGKGEETVECRTFSLEELTTPKYVVVFTRYRGKLLLSRLRQRDTWETQGGHIEPGETPEQAARRELWEESGAGEFTLIPLCGYRAGDETGSAAGAVFALATDDNHDRLPLGHPLNDSFGGFVRIAARELTYPGITPVLWRRAREYFPGVGEA